MPSSESDHPTFSRKVKMSDDNRLTFSRYVKMSDDRLSWIVRHSIMLKVTWRRFDQSAKQLVVGRATIKYDKQRLKMPHEGAARVRHFKRGSSYLIDVWPTMRYFADWSKRCHVTFIIIECWTCRRSTVRYCKYRTVSQSRDRASLQVVLTDHH